jgi:hypothetical protein
MTASKDGIETKPDWMEYGTHSPECKECSYFKHNHCDNPNSDHYGHMLMPFHPACKTFMEK